ncbi:MAG: hypothetical protein ABI995_14755 [Acidobacteriota bacterium]
MLTTIFRSCGKAPCVPVVLAPNRVRTRLNSMAIANGNLARRNTKGKCAARRCSRDHVVAVTPALTLPENPDQGGCSARVPHDLRNLGEFCFCGESYLGRDQITDPQIGYGNPHKMPVLARAFCVSGGFAEMALQAALGYWSFHDLAGKGCGPRHRPASFAGEPGWLGL